MVQLLFMIGISRLVLQKPLLSRMGTFVVPMATSMLRIMVRDTRHRRH